MTSEFRDFTGITQARLTLITSRSILRRNITIQAAILDRPRKVCPSVLHEKPTSPSSTHQVLWGNGGISRARAESSIAECANERFLPPFFSLSTTPYTHTHTHTSAHMHTHKNAQPHSPPFSFCSCLCFFLPSSISPFLPTQMTSSSSVEEMATACALVALALSTLI